MHHNKLALVAMLALFNVACGGGGDGGSDEEYTPPARKTVVSASDTLHRTLDASLRLDLSSAVHATDGAALTLSRVEPLSTAASCANIRINDLGFSVEGLQAGTSCLYRYTARSGDGESASALSWVVPAEQLTLDSPSLPPQGVALMAAPDASALICIAAQEGDVAGPAPDRLLLLPETEGYTLNSVMALGSANAALAARPNCITVSGYGDPGITRLFYEMVKEETVDEMETQDLRIGVIDVTVSSPATQAPYARSFVVGETACQVKVGGKEQSQSSCLPGQPIVINLDEALCAVQPEADGRCSMPLTQGNLYFYSFDGLIDKASGESYSSDEAIPVKESDNKIAFHAARPGLHYITYVVLNDDYGYAQGVITVKVGHYYGPITLNSGSDAPLTFLPPLTWAQAEQAGVKGKASDAESYGRITYQAALLDYPTSASVCALRGGRVASLAEMQALINSTESDVVQKRGKWPVQHEYFFSDVTKPGVQAGGSIDLRSGAIALRTEKALQESLYSACVDKPLAPQPDYELEIQWKESMETGETFPFKVTYWVTGDSSTKQVYDGTIIATPLGGIAASVDKGAGGFTLKAGNTPGHGTMYLYFEGGDLDSMQVYRPLSVYRIDKSRIFGTNKDKWNQEIRQQYFSIEDSQQIMLYHGSIVDSLGVSREERIGGDSKSGGGASRVITDIAKLSSIEINSCTFTDYGRTDRPWSGDPNRVIYNMTFNYMDRAPISVADGCHQKSNVLWDEDFDTCWKEGSRPSGQGYVYFCLYGSEDRRIMSVSQRSVDLRGKELIGIRGFSNDGNDYLNGVEIITRTFEP